MSVLMTKIAYKSGVGVSPGAARRQLAPLVDGGSLPAPSRVTAINNEDGTHTGWHWLSWMSAGDPRGEAQSYLATIKGAGHEAALAPPSDGFKWRELLPLLGITPAPKDATPAPTDDVPAVPDAGGPGLIGWLLRLGALLTGLGLAWLGAKKIPWGKLAALGSRATSEGWVSLDAPREALDMAQGADGTWSASLDDDDDADCGCGI